MDYPCVVESGIQVLARLIRPPSLLNLHRHLLHNGPKPAELIELNYDEHSPRNVILKEIISNAVLPEEAGGKGVEVLLIITDGHFDPHTVKDTQCLDRIHVMRVYDSTQLFVTILSVESLLSSNPKICLVVLDTASAFYWSDRLRDSRISRMDTYLKKVVRHLQNATKQYKTVVLYTKPSYFASKPTVEPPTEYVDHIISLRKSLDDDGAFVADVINNGVNITNTFSCESNKINWNF